MPRARWSKESEAAGMVSILQAPIDSTDFKTVMGRNGDYHSGGKALYCWEWISQVGFILYFVILLVDHEKFVQYYVL